MWGTRLRRKFGGRIVAMRTTLVMMAMALQVWIPQLLAQATHSSIPCPVLLVNGRATHDSIELSFMNKGKMPIQQLSLVCSPPMAGRARDAICHTESGLFYPGQRYSMTFGYAAKPGTARSGVTLLVTGARLGNGDLWMARSARACRPLKVFRSK
jgi:hypothetical protein